MVAPRLEDLLREQAMRRAEVEAAGAYFVGAIDDGSAEMFNRSLLLMSVARAGRTDRPITVYINSPGGAVGAGFSMMEMVYHMKREYGVRIAMHVTGSAFSMAAVLVQAGDHRSLGPLSTMMLHSSSWALSGEDERIFRDYQKLSDHYQNVTSQIFAQRTGKHDARWWRRFIYSGRDRFLGAEECLELGLIDEIAEVAESPDPATVRPPR
ncbi:MAG: ClpP family protease [Dehalococcoidia bacterium]